MRGRRGVLLTCLGLAACGTFVGTSSSETNDGGASNSNPDPRANSSADGAVPLPDGPADGTAPSGNSFCATHAPSLFCADFDEGVEAGTGWGSRSNNGTFSLVPTFVGGSAPNALAESAGAALTTPTIALADLKSRTLIVDVPIFVAASPTGTFVPFMTIAFDGTGATATQSSPVSMATTGTLQCGSVTSIPFGSGLHDIQIKMAVLADGTVTSFVCVIDGGTQAASNPVSTTGNVTLSISVGPTTPSSSWVGIFDNIRIYTE